VYLVAVIKRYLIQECNCTSAVSVCLNGVNRDSFMFLGRWQCFGTPWCPV